MEIAKLNFLLNEDEKGTMNELIKPEPEQPSTSLHPVETLQPCEISFEEDHYSNPELIHASQTHEKRTMFDNQVLYQELKRDFNPITRGLMGLIVGTIFGMILNLLVAMSTTVPLCAILGCFIALVSSFKRPQDDNL